MANRPLFCLGVCALLLITPATVQYGPGSSTARHAISADAVLRPTVHPAMPARVAEVWLAPDDDALAAAGTPALRAFAAGMAEYAAGNYAKALPLLNPSRVADTALADYAWYYSATAHFRLGRLDEARTMFASVRERAPASHVTEAAMLGEAEVLEARLNHAAAARAYAELSERQTSMPAEILFRLGRTLLAAGDREGALLAYLRVYYEHPLSDVAPAAGRQVERLLDVRRPEQYRRVFELDLSRAERLFGARRYEEARAAFEALRGRASGDDRQHVQLRLVAIDYHLRRYANARDGARPHLERGSRRDEARFYHLSALRALGNNAEYVTRARRLIADFPESPWTEEAMNNLATHFILADQTEAAMEVFRDLYARFPGGVHAERAAWRRGWWAYRNGLHEEAIRHFESAAATFPRSNYRPAYLYWAARAHDRLGATDTARERYALVIADYLNTYYGRLAAQRMAERETAVRTAATLSRPWGSAAFPGSQGGSALPPPPHTPPLNQQVVRLLLALGLYDDAQRELRYAQRVWGDSSVLQATVAWIHNQRGELRVAVNMMKRAYPQYMTEGGENVPEEIMKVIFPMAYWDVIQRHSASHGVDAHLVAALVLQESTFSATIRSSANAHGLMQIIPPTGRRLAQSLGIRQFSVATLRNPDTNVRMGTYYLASLINRFKAPHLALAGYNAGEHRVVRWLADRRELEPDEFVDDIPFPETQNYVKHVLGAAEDYRRLYGGVPTGAVVAQQ